VWPVILPNRANASSSLNPFIKPVVGGLFSPEDGFVRPLDVLRNYLDRARDLGVEIRCGEEADTFDIDARGAWTGPPVKPVERHVLTTVRTDVLPPDMPMTVFVDDGFHLRDLDDLVLAEPCEPAILEQRLGGLVELDIVLTKSLEQLRLVHAADAHCAWHGSSPTVCLVQRRPSACRSSVVAVQRRRPAPPVCIGLFGDARPNDQAA